MTFLPAQRARALHQKGVDCTEAGEDEAAIGHYTAALALDPKRPDTLYNLGLIYKYRGAWAESRDFNRRAAALRPDDEATLWNLAIAATALRDWGAARAAWRDLGIITTAGEGPIDECRGRTPVRLNADRPGDCVVEVVWSEALCPVRSRIINIPTPETGFRYGDIVLHDGAPVGYRLNSAGQECPVFNVLELFEPSQFSTYVASLETRDPEDISALERIGAAAQVEIEDWTGSLRTLCKDCSEGRPHDHHDHNLQESGAWQTARRVGLAALDSAAVDSVLRVWMTEGRCAVEMRCALTASSP